jgi:glycosyltransferase involved in cell wall biosynthesis
MQSLNEYGLHLAKGLAARDDVAEVIVIADRLADPAPEIDLGPKIRVERVWTFNSLRAGPAILRALRRAAPDGAIWNLQTASFGDRELPAALGLLAPAAARALGVPSGIIAHNIIAGIDLEQTQLKGQRLRQGIVRLGGAVVTRAMLAATYMTVTLRSYRDHLVTAYPRADVHLIPHGTFDTQFRALSLLRDRPRRIVTMGKFGTYKRLETLLQAFDMLRRAPDMGDLELLIGGTDHPGTPGYLSGLATARAGDSGVIFHGYVAEDDIPEFFGNAQLSVFDYSATTGSSGVLHQTASYGTVPIFPKIGDFVDLCRDEGLSGAHYAPGDATGMAGAMADMLACTDRAQSIADTNREAALGMPFADVIGFHVDRLTPRPRSTKHGRLRTA